MRCLALAQAWRCAGGQASFVCGVESAALAARLESERMTVRRLSRQMDGTEDAIQTANLAVQENAFGVVVDGYHFDATFQRIVKNARLRLLYIDDNGICEHYYADIVLNQNLHASQSLYGDREPYTQLLLGPRYALLRQEFLKWRGWKRNISDTARKVLVTLGGSDPDNATLMVIQALQQTNLNGLEAVIVMGDANPHREEVKIAASDVAFNIRIENNVADMPALMAWADVAVLAGGITCWEAAFMGLPAVVLTLASNQYRNAEALGEAQVIINLGPYHQLSAEVISQAIGRLLKDVNLRATMARRGQGLVDGEGDQRVLMHLRNKLLRLRRARESDCRILWEWANDTAVRAVSFSLEPISWERHSHWFKSKLSDPNCLLYLAANVDDSLIGQIRFDINNTEAVVSVSVSDKFRNKGYGSELIRLGSQELFNTSSVTLIHAYVKQDNEASIRAFLKAGFKINTTVTVAGQLTKHLSLGKDESSSANRL
jgi:UDP-2,4-diacetamido-2,4,6-trideoxy-beta-L-altropyranose hydrolase